MKRKVAVIVGIAGNLNLAFFMILFSFRYMSWQREVLPPAVELSVDRKFNYLLYTELFPLVALMAILSAFIIWGLRKRD